MTEKTDLQRFIEFYESLGIHLEPQPDKESSDGGVNGGSRLVMGGDKAILFAVVCDEEEENIVTRSPKFGGYSDAYTVIHFDMKGKFIKQNFWE